MSVNSTNDNLAQLRAQQELARRQAMEAARKQQQEAAAKAAADAAARKLPTGLPDEDKQSVRAGAAQKAREENAKNGINEDAFVASGAGGKSQDELKALYEKFDTDGKAGLSQDEFDAAYDAATEFKGGGSTYTVKAGDSLSGIAAKNGGGDWHDLYEQNKQTIGDNPDRIDVGQKLTMGPKPQDIIDSAVKAGLETYTASSGSSATAAEHASEQAHLNNQLTIQGAVTALGDLPKDSADYKAYSQKVDQLKADYKTMYNDEWQPPLTDNEKIDAYKKVIDDAKIVQPGNTSGTDAGDRSATATKQQNDQTLADAKAALAQIPEDDPAHADASSKVSQLQTAYDKQYPPAADPKPADTTGSGTPADPSATTTGSGTPADPATPTTGTDTPADPSTATPATPPKAGTSDVSDKLNTVNGMEPSDPNYFKSVQEAVKAVDHDKANPNDLKAIAYAYSQIPNNAEAAKAASVLNQLAAITSDKNHPGITDNVLNLLQDHDNDRGDMKAATQDAAGAADQTEIKLLADLGDIYSSREGNNKGMGDVLRAIAAAPTTDVRKNLMLGFDGDSDDKDFRKALDAANALTPPKLEDFQALQAFAKRAEDIDDFDKKWGASKVLEVVVNPDNFAKLAGSSQSKEIFQQIRNIVYDNDDNSSDLARMGVAAAQETDHQARQFLLSIVGKIGDARYEAYNDGDTHTVMNRIKAAQGYAQDNPDTADETLLGQIDPDSKFR